MKRSSVFPLLLCFAAMLMFLTGCFLPAAPDVTPTISAEGMETAMIESVTDPSMGVTPVVEDTSPQATVPSMAPTATPIPPVVATTAPEVATTEAPTQVPTQVPTQAPTEQPTVAATTAPSGTERIHVVKAGENLYRIALQYGMKYMDLATYNNIVNPHRISVGQQIRIPAGGSPTTPTTGYILYTVQPGENLFRIAMRYGMNYLSLAQYNGITNPHQIYSGQQIRIPSSQ